MVELIQTIFSDKYREITIPILRNILENGLKLINLLKSDFNLLDQELTFLCPENRQKWRVLFKSKRGLLGGKKKFPFPLVRKVSVTTPFSLADLTSQCINMLPEGGFELLYKNLQEDIPYILAVEFDIKNPRFIDNLVYRKVQRDVPHKFKRYWMQAQLRFVDVLDKMFSNIRFEDLNFDVRVHTHEEIRTSIPKDFEREVEIIVKWMGETDRGKKSRLSREHLKLLRRRRGGGIRREKSVLNLLQELQDIFLPKTFRSFIKVKQDFYYHDCLRGADYYAAPFPTWPKFMTVITRTSLNLKKPAAKGYLDFDYQDFKRKVEELFKRFF